MDPASATQNSNIFTFEPININRNRIYFEEINGLKYFYLGHFNDCNHTLVTALATFDSNYQVIECDIEATIIEDYQALKDQDNNLSLSDLFSLKDQLIQNEKYILSLKDKKIIAALMINGHEIPVSTNDLLEEFIKEDKKQYMDHNDLVLDYVCNSLSSNKLYRSKNPLQEVEKAYRTKQLIKTEPAQKIAG